MGFWDKTFDFLREMIVGILVKMLMFVLLTVTLLTGLASFL